jgi:fatty acid desaturase
MANELMRDARIRTVTWRDLARPTAWQTARELTLVVPWLGLSLAFGQTGLWDSWVFLSSALCCSFMFFLAGLRVVHNAFHHAIGISRLGDDLVIFGLSLLMGWPLHAVKVNHLRHHRFCMDVKDVEALSARMRWWQALLLGPIFPCLLLYHGLLNGRPAERCWICLECGTYTFAVVAIGVCFPLDCLVLHVLCMMLGQCLTGFFAVWTVHHDCEPAGTFARTESTVWKNWFTMNMFFHLEHHLFPAVPTCNLPQLAERLQQAAPDLRTKQVF